MFGVVHELDRLPDIPTVDIVLALVRRCARSAGLK